MNQDPIKIDEVRPSAEEIAHGRDAHATKQRILIADDEPNIQTMVRMCLSTEGYEVTVVSDGRAALDAIRRLSPDLLLLDLSMPVMDGMSVLRELQDLRAIPGVRVVVMTAHGSVRTAVQAIRLGASDFLEKPFRPEDLRISVASVLDEAPTHGERSENYDDVLAAVRDALRSGKLDAAESLLMRAGTITDTDPGFLNLAGVIHEAHGRRSSAKRFYQKALASDPVYYPAMQNLGRLQVLERGGVSHGPVSLGDRAPVLNGRDT
jgi:DNA-binding response OmpR family regulator